MRLSLLVPSCYLLGCSTKAIYACARKPCVMPHSKSGTRHETVELILVRKKSYICTVATIQSQRSVRCTRTTSKSSVECVVRKKVGSSGMNWRIKLISSTGVGDSFFLLDLKHPG
ncbi:hypothetical protein EDD17DRAFT_1668335 [Pisolithus thermaeus]|nr:hypothetical protein EDD17DRAFT_1668335 [Pisolithus thermaeus]